MNPSIIHREAERKAKCWLREKYTTTGTSVPTFEANDTYEAEVFKLADNLYNFIKDDEKRNYLQTITLDI